MKGTEIEQEHLSNCKSSHYWTKPFLDGQVDFEQEELLICNKTQQYVDLNQLGKYLSMVLN